MAKTCNSCKADETTIPYVVYEANEMRHERREKRYVWLIAILIFLLVGTNIGWLIYESQFEVVQDTTITQENENGYNNYIGNDGDINYGKANDKNQKISKKKIKL